MISSVVQVPWNDLVETSSSSCLVIRSRAFGVAAMVLVLCENEIQASRFFVSVSSSRIVATLHVTFSWLPLPIGQVCSQEGSKCTYIIPGAIIGDGDRKCALILLLGPGRKKSGRWNGQSALGVLRRRTGTSALSALPVRIMAAKNFLSTNRKSTFLSLFLSHQWRIFKSLFDAVDPKFNTSMSVVIILK